MGISYTTQSIGPIIGTAQSASAYRDLESAISTFDTTVGPARIHIVDSDDLVFVLEIRGRSSSLEEQGGSGRRLEQQRLHAVTSTLFHDTSNHHIWMSLLSDLY